MRPLLASHRRARLWRYHGPMQPMPAQEWLDRCTAELLRHIQGEGVEGRDLAQLASDMLEEPAYRLLGPEEAAQAWARDFA